MIMTHITTTSCAQGSDMLNQAEAVDGPLVNNVEYNEYDVDKGRLHRWE
jgi:hypothetical protein